MNLNKICPNCAAEYLPHIEKCSDCGAVLLLPEEYRQAQEEEKTTYTGIMDGSGKASPWHWLRSMIYLELVR